MRQPSTLSVELARFITRTAARDIPRDVMQLGKRSLLDGLGLALAGNRAESGHVVRAYLKSLGVPLDRGATVIGTGIQVPPRFAAFANGVAIHADDYDDTQLAVASDRVYGLLTHPTAPVLPAVLALAEQGNRSGLDLLLAYQIAIEVETKLAEAINPRHYSDGFHSTATFGAIGAAAGAARLLGLDEAKTAQALSLGATQAAGLRENFGTMTKPFHPGRAAESGVLAAELVRLGWTAAPNAIEARRGFFNAAGGGYDPGAIRSKLGKPWTFAFPGVSIKPHPSGSLTHPGMAEMLALIEAHDIRPAQVRKVRVGTNRHMPNTLIHRSPKTELQAKFSMEFCMAILLIERRAGLAQFTDAMVNRADVQQMMKKIDFGVHPEAEAAGYEKMTTIIEVELAGGHRVSGRADFGKGSPAHPMSDAEVAGKFRECAVWGRLPARMADTVIDIVFSLESLKRVRDLTRLLAITPMAKRSKRRG